MTWSRTVKRKLKTKRRELVTAELAATPTLVNMSGNLSTN